MLLFHLLPLLVSSSVAIAAPDEITLSAPGIKASFVPFGARLKSLQVPDRNGEWKEINLGYKSAQEYRDEKSPSYFGAVIGRYANRVRGGQFSVNGETYQVPTNEHDGRNTLHGGNVGYDAREWEVVTANESTVTFSLMDYGFEGFPGNVLAFASYTVSPGKLTTVLTAHALDKATPILLTTHPFFNLGADATSTILDDTLQLRDMSRFVRVDDISLPTGEIVDISRDHPLNFANPVPIRQALAAKECGAGCQGIDNCFILDGGEQASIVWSSPVTGIRMIVSTNQPAIQLYACSGMDGSLGTTIGKAAQYGCLAIEPQGWIDGINHPEWSQDQVYQPGSAPFVNTAEYVFDTVGTAGHDEL